MPKFDKDFTIDKFMEANDNKLPNYAFPGGYPIAYYTEEFGQTFTYCGDCTTKFYNGEFGDRETEKLWGYEALEGTEEDHGVVICENCGDYIVKPTLEGIR